ncbi:MAG: hypothetical protein QFX33_00840 [Candidatus Nezhaarchaeota archaeon]|nr:hypothetical protein [Candidatus Nezhaarchaeota archaeon]
MSSIGPTLKSKLKFASAKLRVQLGKLARLHSKLLERERSLFEKVVHSYSSRSADLALMYAAELAEVRRITRTVDQCMVVLEEALTTLRAAKDVGDVASALARVAEVVKAVRCSLAHVLPGVEEELEGVVELLGRTLYEPSRRLQPLQVARAEPSQEEESSTPGSAEELLAKDRRG